jgi:metal-responsive CopG/Arc/MetJ family transcriptional regulator
MTTVSVRLPDDLLKEADKRARELHIPRAEYIRRAIEALNAEVSSQQRRDRMIKASQRVRAESMRVNAEFSAIEDAPNA